MHSSTSSGCFPAPLSHEPQAQEINSSCDYSIRITAEMARAGLAPRPVRIYADGVYDMFHSGHARQLMQAKRAFPNAYLIVGVCNDADVHQYKGRTVMNEAERYEAVRHCRYVDEVVTDAPWSISQEFLKLHKIDFVAHDDIPYASSDSEDVYKPIKEAGMFVATQRTEGISTTDVIGRIVRDYDVYLRRNIKRGLSRKDLNISFMKEKKLKFQDNFETMIKRGSKFIKDFDVKRRELIDHLEDMSQEVFRSFMHIFGSDGRLRNWLNHRVHTLTDAEDGITSSSSSSEISVISGEDLHTSASPKVGNDYSFVVDDGSQQFDTSQNGNASLGSATFTETSAHKSTQLRTRKRPASVNIDRSSPEMHLLPSVRRPEFFRHAKLRRMARDGITCSETVLVESPQGRTSLNAYRLSR